MAKVDNDYDLTKDPWTKHQGIEIKQGMSKLWAKHGGMSRWNAMRIRANECDKSKTWAGAKGLRPKWMVPNHVITMNGPKIKGYGGQWSSKGTKHTKGEEVDETRVWGYPGEKSSFGTKYSLIRVTWSMPFNQDLWINHDASQTSLQWVNLPQLGFW